MNCTTLKKHRGATIVEFSFCLILLFSLISAAFDLGIAVYRHNTLANTTTTVVRDAALMLATRTLPKECTFVEPFPNTCAELQQCAIDMSEDYLERTFSVPEGSVGFNLTFTDIANPDNQTGRPLITLNANWSYKCFFCFVVPGGLLTLNAAAQAIVEDIGFTCST